jgi:multiple sugar transport system substrate-binding protein
VRVKVSKHPSRRKPSELRKRIHRGAALVAAVPLLAALGACSSGGASAEGDSAGARTLTFAYYGDAQQAKSFQPLFDQFNESHPDIKLEAQGIPSTNWANFTNTVATRLAGGQKLDMIQIATEGQRLFASKGLLEPLDPFMEKDKDVVDEYFADLDPNVREWNSKYASTDENTYYMPGSYNTVGLYVNKDLFEKAGVALPTGDWTWDEFRAAGEKIKAATGAYLYPAAAGGQFPDVSPWLLSNGANTFNENWDEATFNTPEAIEAAEYLRSLVEDGLSPVPGGEFDQPTQFARGELATMPGGRWPTGDIRRLDFVENTAIVNFPKNSQNGSPVGWDAWPILKASDNKEDAWTFIKFLISKEAGDYFASNPDNATVPARISAATSEAYLENAPEGTTKLVDALAWATPIPAPDRGPEAEAIILEAWMSILTGTAEAEDALNAANEKLNALL